MALTLEQVFQFTIEGLLGESTRKVGEKTAPTSLALSGPVVDTGNFTVPDNYTTVDVWETGQQGLTTPVFVVILSNADVWVELANTNASPDRRVLFQVRANAVCVIPSSYLDGYVSDTSHFDGAVLVAATDYFNIQSVRVMRNVADAGGDATVRVVLIG